MKYLIDRYKSSTTAPETIANFAFLIFIIGVIVTAL